MESDSVCDHRSVLLITSTITDRIERHEVLLLINQSHDITRGTHYPSVIRCHTKEKDGNSAKYATTARSHDAHMKQTLSYEC